MLGPPGAGKSFAVEQDAEDPDLKAQLVPLVFNLSQFTSATTLSEAFHEVRNWRLRGKMPLVFWDEFDAVHERHALGWLKSFLSPMQDGKFTDEHGTHHLGRAVYVFAGSSYPTLAELRDMSDSDQILKVRDFLRRLSAHLDVKGVVSTSPGDKLWVIRCAVPSHSLPQEARAQEKL